MEKVEVITGVKVEGKWEVFSTLETGASAVA